MCFNQGIEAGFKNLIKRGLTAKNSCYFAAMFTGIIESVGMIDLIIEKGSNKTFWINSPISEEFKVDQSVSHNGVCLTIEEVKNKSHRVTAIKETLEKSNLNSWSQNDKVNIERCLQFNGRLDGHLVQGHTDTTGVCTQIKSENGSWTYDFSFSENFANLIVEKGSIALNGISLTVFNVERNKFSVAVIPYTYEHTNMMDLKMGGTVNLEFDIIGKYVLRNKEIETIK